VLHFLRPEDHFVDIGANVGTYTILASGVCGSASTAIEPVASTASALQKNVEINRLNERVRIEVAAVGDEAGEVSVSNEQDCTNHVLGPGEAGSYEKVALQTLDDLLAGNSASLIKVDVEGFEINVLKGGERTFSDPRLKAVIMEVNGSGRRYGVEDSDLLAELKKHGFEPHGYQPRERRLVTADAINEPGGNLIFLRDAQEVGERLRQAEPFRVMGDSI
jgi:FkbM family methyltransferase